MKDSAERSEANTILSIALEAVELGEKATPGPWLLKPTKYDDWGWVRAGDGGPLVAIGREGTRRGYEEDALYLDECRAKGIDPCANNAALIAHAGTHYAALARAYVEVVEALRKRSILGHVRMTHGGGTVPSGGSCALCKTEWDYLDINGRPVDGKEHHAPNCLLAFTKENTVNILSTRQDEDSQAT